MFTCRVDVRNPSRLRKDAFRGAHSAHSARPGSTVKPAHVLHLSGKSPNYSTLAMSTTIP